MSAATCAVVFAASLIFLAVEGAHARRVDTTVQRGHSGSAVVEAAVARIQLSKIFMDDNLFLRRVAFVETRDGSAIETYRVNYNGGIWQVDEDLYNRTVDVDTYPVLVNIHSALRKTFRINWLATTWSDLRQPLFSALAARIVFEISELAIPAAYDVEGQAQFWIDVFNSDDADAVDMFIQSVDELESGPCYDRGLDLAFVFDSSRSVGPRNFSTTLDFAVNITKVLEIGPADTRVAAISFSNTAAVAFYLNESTTPRRTVHNVLLIPYAPGSNRDTNTTGALNLLHQKVFMVDAGARPRMLGIPRVAFVITDGRSEISHDSTIPSAKKLHSDGVTVFAIGIADVNVQELQAIASGPDKMFLLEEFDISRFPRIKRILTLEVCMAPAAVTVEQTIENTLENREVSFLQYELPSEGLTLRLQTTRGRAVLYISDETRNPNEALYDYKLDTAMETQLFIDPTVLGIDGEVESGRSDIKREVNNATVTVYVSIEGSSENGTTFTLHTSIGDAENGTGPTSVGDASSENGTGPTSVGDPTSGFGLHCGQCTLIAFLGAVVVLTLPL